jgi:hypothetical protein
VEVEVVAAGAAVEDEWQDGDECGERDQEIRKPVALHGVSIAELKVGLRVVDGDRCLVKPCLGGSKKGLGHLVFD